MESDIEKLGRIAFSDAVNAIRAESVRNGTDKVTLDEIDAEVAAVRAERKQNAVIAPGTQKKTLSR